MPSAAPNPSDPTQPAHVQPASGNTTGGFSDPRGPALPGAPAGLHAPWRLEYLEAMGEQESTPGAPKAAPKKASTSFLVDYWNTPAADAQNHVIVRGPDGLILLNAFPYASGHLLVALGEPRPTLLDYTPPQRAALWRLVDCAADLVTRTLEPQGINIGVNQGRAAGAGIPGHLHVHLVPRWGGDTNFITVVGQVRIIPASLETMAERYRRTWEHIRGQWD
jgi:ATP adenylyltransferase